MISDSAVYLAGHRRPGALDPTDAFEARSDDDAMVWIDLALPSPDELSLIADELQLHPLVVEDISRPHQRPKLELYPSSAFMVLKTVEWHGADTSTLDFGELQVVVGPSFVVTVQHGPARPASPARTLLEGQPELLSRGVSAILYALADAVVDDYERACDEIEQQVDLIEEQVFTPGATNAAELIFAAKRSTLTFLRNVMPLEEALGRLENNRVLFEVDEAVVPYFRDVNDHLARVRSRLEQARDLLTAALDANHAQIGIRQNEDMRAISGWAAVIAVPTLFAGIWGMNFAHMPELNTTWGYPAALATIFGSSAATYRVLKRNGWL